MYTSISHCLHPLQCLSYLICNQQQALDDTKEMQKSSDLFSFYFAILQYAHDLRRRQYTHLHTYTLTHLHTHTHIISLSLLFLCNFDSCPVHHTKEGRLILYIFRPGLHKMTYMPFSIDPKQTKKRKVKKKDKELKEGTSSRSTSKNFFSFLLSIYILRFLH